MVCRKRVEYFVGATLLNHPERSVFFEFRQRGLQDSLKPFGGVNNEAKVANLLNLS